MEHRGFGEMKFHVAADGPELRRIYALAADLRVPILIHFQEVDHFPNEGTWSTGFAQTFESVLKAYPRTTFIGHADAFWANVSADYRNEAAYPTGPIKRGGVTDKWLGDYPNLFGDMSANSGNNAMSRDPEFTSDFLKRHQEKLFFGSDCGCADGHGGGVSQNNNPAAARMAGKCVARETLSSAEAVSVTRRLREDRLGQRAQAAADSGVACPKGRRGAWRADRVSRRSSCQRARPSPIQSALRSIPQRARYARIPVGERMVRVVLPRAHVQLAVEMSQRGWLSRSESARRERDLRSYSAAAAASSSWLVEP